MIVRMLITLALSLPALWLVLRYNMHMFQLNSYKNNEQWAWLNKNFKSQWILSLLAALGAIRILISDAERLGWLRMAAEVLIWLALGVTIIVYRLMVEMNSKKPLVFTPRVKRMIACDFIICIILTLMVLLRSGGSTLSADGSSIVITAYGGMEYVNWLLSPLIGALPIFVAAQMLLIMPANTINRPIEQAVNNHYLNDARRILDANPDLTVIGVTGSYGKTSVKFYLETLLRAKYSVFVTPESYNTPMGVVKAIRNSLKPSHEIFVCEMGARYVGEIKEVCDIVNPRHGVITSIGPQHLDTFESMSNIQMTKFELADALPEGGMLFLNADSEYINEHFDYLIKSGADLPPAYADPVMYHANGADSGYYASDVILTPSGTTFTANAPDGSSCSYDMKLVGAHNIINVMGAVAVAHEMGIDLEDLKIPMRRIKSVPHRMEMRTEGSVTIIDDAFNSNPIGSKAAVETLAMFDGVRILITPGMVELGSDEAEYNTQFGGYAASACDYILLVGGRRTDPIRKGAVGAGFPEDKCINFDKVEDAIKYAYGIKTNADVHKYILLENDLPDNY